MDGVPGISQCSILPNQSFNYLFSTNNQSGTYWYHSHHLIQYGDGLKGIFIIQNPNDPFQHFYDNEEIFQITDWYHIPVHILLNTYLTGTINDPIPDCLLFNGIGQFNCHLYENCSFYRSIIQTNSRKRYRIINTSIYSTITITIDQHQMKLIEMDGIYLNGNEIVQSIRINPGQRYSFLLHGNENSSQNYWIRVTTHPFIQFNNQYLQSNHSTVYAILQYNSNEFLPSFHSLHNDFHLIQQSILNGQHFVDEINLIPMNLTKYEIPKKKVFQTIILNAQFKGGNPGGMFFNNEMFIHPRNTTFLSLILQKNQSEIHWPSTITIKENEIYDIIINNNDYSSHPFHLHGHHVWILSQGKSNEGFLNQTQYETMNFNLNNVIYRDTFSVTPYSYLIFRFYSNNPGIWMLHCHNDWHLQIGMAFVFVESPKLIQQTHSNLSIPDKCYK
ncbi:unnamed protein product [Adineta ricciae]|nr:unnamed protein product [Adineta ricciae]